MNSDTHPRYFSKSRLLAWRQCPRRLWLEVHHPELGAAGKDGNARLQVGHQVGEIARRIYDPEGRGTLIDIERDGFAAALSRSAAWLASSDQPIFEAGLRADGVLAFADLMLPERGPAKETAAPAWRMVEVKSSTSVKDYHRDDLAIQAYAARSAGLDLKSIALAVIDSSWVYPGGEDYRGLLREEDLTAEAFARHAEVGGWIAQARDVAAQTIEPNVTTGPQCSQPFECSFHGHCSRDEVQPEYPIHWLPRLSASTQQALGAQGTTELRDVPDDLLNDTQRRVKTHTLAGTVFFDSEGAATDVAPHGFPAYFLDFETIQFAVPIWKGTRPYQQIPFQFSLHILDASGRLEHAEFLDLTGDDPSLNFAHRLIAACGDHGPVYVYSAGFETARIRELASRFPHLCHSLLAINARVVDLLPVARSRYYHPSQKGSWSIKAVLPAVASELRYDALDGVQDGGMAMDAFLEAIHAETEPARKAEIERQLLTYCELDTYAMVRLWQVFAGREDFITAGM